ncbi:hypothetical protein [Streptomyces tendae]|uniref:hypothetical protein n=1 Tax=Streptomyces tendae TaxID=1932 RepID=UPI001F0EE1D3|nr:hypothetical protein [Streptomyces tendae]
MLRAGKRVAMPLKLRALLGLLAVQPDQVVRHDEMADVLWPDQPPLSHANLLHTYAARCAASSTRTPGAQPAGGSARCAAATCWTATEYAWTCGVRRTRRPRPADRRHRPAEALELYGGALRSRQGRLLEDVSHLWQHPRWCGSPSAMWTWPSTAPTSRYG